MKRVYRSLCAFVLSLTLLTVCTIPVRAEEEDILIPMKVVYDEEGVHEYYSLSEEELKEMELELFGNSLNYSEKNNGVD